MATRRSDALYPGPRSRMRLEDVARLPSAVVTPKVDGIMVRVLTGADGLVSHVFMRSGESAPAELVASFRKVRHVPSSILVGEAEAMSEWAQRTIAIRQYPLIHLWDCQRLAGRDLTRSTYQERRDALLRAESALVIDDPDQANRDSRGVHHAPDGSFARYIPRAGWRRMPVVPSLPASKADLAWSEWVERDGHEGLVVNRLGGRFASRAASAKVKQTDTLDATVIARDKGAAIVAWNGSTFAVSCAGKRNAAIAPGDVVAIAHEGWLERRAEPKHPRAAHRIDLGRKTA